MLIVFSLQAPATNISQDLIDRLNQLELNSNDSNCVYDSDGERYFTPLTSPDFLTPVITEEDQLETEIYLYGLVCLFFFMFCQ